MTNPVDDTSGSHDYVIVSPEMNLTPKQKLLCREAARQLVQEVRLSQRQLLFLMGLLVAELEDRESMVVLNKEILNARTRLDEREALTGGEGTVMIKPSGLIGV